MVEALKDWQQAASANTDSVCASLWKRLDPGYGYVHIVEGNLAAVGEADRDFSDPAGLVESAGASVHIDLSQTVDGARR